MELYDAHMHSCHSPGFTPVPGKTVLSCAAGPEDWEPLLRESRREIRIFLGLHPMVLPADPGILTALLNELSEYLRSTPKAGVGECGLDRRYYKTRPRGLQEKALRFQIRLADSLARPLNLHQVKAAGALAELLEDERPETALIIHGFKEKKETAERYLRRNAHLSFGPGLHWEDESFRDLFRSVPRDRILLESDWPYREAPYNTVMNSLYEKAAEVLGIDRTALLDIVKNNGKVFTD